MHTMRSPLLVCTASRTTPKDGVFYTSLEGNSWCLEIERSMTQVHGLRVFVDPWLLGNLYFGPKFLFEGVKKTLRNKKLEEFGPIDLIVLSQGLPDHAHIPTLQQLDKNIPVVASRKASKVCQALGYKNIETLKSGEVSSYFSDIIEIMACEGSQVGPPYEPSENGYIFHILSNNYRIFYEPHGSFAPATLNTLQKLSVQTVISPVTRILLKPIPFPIINGKEVILEMLRLVKPEQILPLMNFALEVRGLLSPFISAEGTFEEFEASVVQASLPTRVILPPVDVPYLLAS
eukprot:jgi/Galph1/3779/GphlegSOOS_G2395.1